MILSGTACTVCPDLDTVTYTLGGVANTQSPVGAWRMIRSRRSAHCSAWARKPWFKIGDRDLATHVYRTSLLRQGKTLTEATQTITRALGIQATILPMTDDRFRTLVETDQGVLEFQEYFVRRQWQPVIKRIIFDGAETAQATPQVIRRAAAGRCDHHRAVESVCERGTDTEPRQLLPRAAASRTRRERNAVQSKDAHSSTPLAPLRVRSFQSPPCHPSSADRPSKGRRPRCSASWASSHRPSPWRSITSGLVTHFVLDQLDADQESAIQSLGMKTLVTNTIMQSVEDRARLAAEVLEFVKRDA